MFVAKRQLEMRLQRIPLKSSHPEQPSRPESFEQRQMRRPILDRLIEDRADPCVMLRFGIESICVDIGLVYGRGDPCVRMLDDMEMREGAMRRMNLNLAGCGKRKYLRSGIGTESCKNNGAIRLLRTFFGQDTLAKS
jgi:hypothetical protein